MATSNQIELKKANEAERANKTREKETERSNRVQERETERKNKSGEGIQRQEARVKAMSAILNPISKVMPNDGWWYNLVPEATESAANISFQTPIGVPTDAFREYHRVQTAIGAPGIMTLPFVPTLGSASSIGSTNPTMLAANKIYVWVRHANSGSRNYEAVDYMQFLLSADSLATVCAHFLKAYKALCTYDNQNKYLGYGILRSMGFSDDGIQSSISTLSASRARYNVLVSSINSLNIPDLFVYFTRHVWMASHLWYDRQDPRAQIYHFVPRGYHVYEYGDTTPGELGQLKYNTFTLGEVTLTSILDVLSDIVDRFLTIEDVGIMGGDSLKAFGSDKMLKLGYLGIEPIFLEVGYSEEVLSQIHNATLNGPIDTDTANIFQRNGRLFQGAANTDYSEIELLSCIQFISTKVTATGLNSTDFVSKFNQDYRIIQTWKKNPTAMDNMVSTRLANSTEIDFGDFTSLPKARIGAHGSEIIVEPAITFTFITSDGEERYTNITFWDMCLGRALPYATTIPGTYDSLVATGLFGFIYNSFRCAPAMRAVSDEVGVQVVTANWRLDPYVQLDDYAIVSNRDLANMHYVALSSLFSIDSAAPKKA